MVTGQSFLLDRPTAHDPFPVGDSIIIGNHSFRRLVSCHASDSLAAPTLYFGEVCAIIVCVGFSSLSVKCNYLGGFSRIVVWNAWISKNWGFKVYLEGAFILLFWICMVCKETYNCGCQYVLIRVEEAWFGLVFKWHFARDKFVVSIHLFIYFLIANLGLFTVNAVFLHESMYPSLFIVCLASLREKKLGENE